MQTLREKLLKAGLVSEEQVKKTEADLTAPPPRAQPRSPPPRREDTGSTDRGSPAHYVVARPQARPLQTDARIPKLPPLPGSKAHQRLESKKQLELDRKLRELVHAAEVPSELGANAFYFVTRKGRLRRMELSDAQAKLLETGFLAVVERPEAAQIEHSLVPADTGRQMLEISPKSVRFLNTPGAAVGFLSDDDVKSHQAADALAGPELPDAPVVEADTSGDEETAESEKPA